jgi:hypothetical protein
MLFNFWFKIFRDVFTFDVYGYSIEFNGWYFESQKFMPKDGAHHDDLIKLTLKKIEFSFTGFYSLRWIRSKVSFFN